jgi:hypothetical protein
MRILMVAAIMLVSGRLTAKTVNYPVPVPSECMQLAEREHVPTMIENRYQALKAEYKLRRLSKADPMVAQCRDAVDRQKAEWSKK